MSVQDNKDLLVNFVTEVIDGRNLEAMSKFLSPNFLHHDLAPGEQTGQRTGVEGQRNFFSRVVFPAFDHFATTFEDLIGENDLVAGRWRQSSDNLGPWLDRRPTGRRTEIAGVSIVRIRNGLIVEEWEGRDGIGLLRQLGVPVTKLRLRPTPLGLTRPIVPLPFRTNGSFGPARAATLQRAKELVGSVYMEAWNGDQVNVLGASLSDRFVLHDPSGLATSADRAASAAVLKGLRTGLPDLGVTVDLQLAEDDRVVSRWTARGTHNGDLFGLRPSGRSVAFTGVSIQQVAGGVIDREWALWDQLALLQQVGALSFDG